MPLNTPVVRSRTAVALGKEQPQPLDLLIRQQNRSLMPVSVQSQDRIATLTSTSLGPNSLKIGWEPIKSLADRPSRDPMRR